MMRVLVTGANRGIGKEIAAQLLDKGWKVAATGRSSEKIEKAAEDLNSNGELLAVTLDVQKEDTIKNAVDKVVDEWGGIDVLINNAGVALDKGKKLTDLEIDTFHEVLDINLTGALRTIKHLLPVMRKQGSGRIVNVSSRLGALANMTSEAGAYKVSKLGMNGMTKILADELRSDNIMIVTTSPGWVRTDMGGPNADRSVDEGASGIVWAAEQNDMSLSGKFFADGKEISF